MAGPNILNFASKVVFLNGQAITLPGAASDPGSASTGDMYYNTTSNTVRFYNGTIWQDMSAGAGAYTVNVFTLSGGNMTDKFVTLTGTPTVPSGTILNIVGGVIQSYSTDFTVIGNQLSWSGLALDGILSINDKLIVQFY